MSDIYNNQKRSQIMSKVKNRNTKPEVEVKKILCNLGYRQYRLYTKKLDCKPDIVFIGMKKAIFVNGCFWHGHTCKKAHLPESNYEFWKNKIDVNKKRDLYNYEELKNKDWEYLIIWECELKKKNKSNLVNKIIDFMER